MRIAMSSGHGLKVRGASGYHDEVDEVRKIVDRVGEIISCVTFHDNTSTNVDQNLATICNWHNAQQRDLDVSVHLNATPGGTGSEVWHYSQATLASEVSAAMAAAGHWRDRGQKQTSGLYFLMHTNKPAILLEVYFCDSFSDCNLAEQHFEDICQAIASSIKGEAATTPPPEAVPLPPKFSQDVIDQICQIASSSLIADYSWRDRGRAPNGFINGMAVAYAQAVERFDANDPVMLEMAKADTRDDDLDALSWYRSNFTAIGMSNEEAGLDTLRHLYVLLMGLGMRESSGKHCEGRDQSASNTSSDTAEAGLFQTSWNAHSCSKQFDTLAGQYDKSSPQGYMSVFAEGVSCGSSSWASYGSGAGYAFQETCKWSPVYAVETCAITLRNLRQHYGPINRKEAELNADADTMFLAIEHYIRNETPPAPDAMEVIVTIEAPPGVKVTIKQIEGEA